MRTAIGAGVVAAALSLAGIARADDGRGGFYVSFGVVRADYFHDHDVDCGCRAECHYYGGKHHYSHRHARNDRNWRYDDRRWDSHRRGGYDYDYDGRHDSRGDRRDYWHDHYVGRGGYVPCHIVRGVHYFRR